MVLVHVDEARHHNRTRGVDYLVEAVGLGRLLGRTDSGNFSPIDRHEAARIHIARGIDRHDISVRDQNSAHRVMPFNVNDLNQGCIVSVRVVTDRLGSELTT